MKLFVMVCGALAAACVWAADYTWTGAGAAGDWTSSANWGVASGYPKAGDTATFTADATITSDFSLEGAAEVDVLTLTIADGATLTIDASISGIGGLTREGAGTLVLKKANPFTGAFLANGWTAKDKTKANILTIIHDGGALGTKSASFDNGLDYSFSSLKIDASAYTAAGLALEVPVPLTLGRLVSETSRPNLQIVGGNVTFQGAISAPSRVTFGGDSVNKVVRFQGTITGSGYFQVTSAFSRGSHLYFAQANSMDYFYLYMTTATVHLHSGVVAGILNVYSSPVMCEGADVFLNIKNKGLPWSSHNTTEGGRIDLNGFDQHFPKAANGCMVFRNTSPYTPISNYGFTSPADKPAKVILEGGGVINAAKSQSFNGQFFGTAGFEWNPGDPDAEFVFSNAVNATSGELLVDSGKVRLYDGASFTNLSRLVVAAGAVFECDNKSCASFRAKEITLAAGATLKLPDGITLETEKLTIGSTVLTEVGRYSRQNYPEVFEGNGAVVIKGVSCRWTGTDNGLWSNPANWEGLVVPGVQHAVTIPAGSRVVLDQSNDPIYSLAIGDGTAAATLVLTNWNTCLQAKYVTVQPKSVLTTMGAFTNEAEKSRVWVKCTDFTLADGATIDMDGKGWMGGHYDLTDTSKTNPSGSCYNDDGVNHGGWGPGRTTSFIGAGASHLGLGASYNQRTSNLGALYDDPYAPIEPGSGGNGLDSSAYGQAWKAIGSGGGAVLIEATGHVVINGQILASGKSSSTHVQYNGNALNYRAYNNQAGSGGAVNISCASISGSGEIHADGGNGGWGLGPAMAYELGTDRTGMPGGGGGVAILYDAQAQTVGAVTEMKISAAAGHFISVTTAKAVSYSGLTWTTVDDCWRASEPGTLYLADPAIPADTKLVDDTLGKGLTGRLFSLTNYTYAGDLDWTYGYVRFGATGAVVTVTGDLNLSGEWSRLDLGGNFVNIKESPYYFTDAGDQALSLIVGGNCSISNGALLSVYAARVTDATTAWGAEVKVSGALAIGTGGRVRPICDARSGGAPRFLTGAFELDATSQIDARGRGGLGGWSGSTFKWLASHFTGFGIGASEVGHSGSSHGGQGGHAFNNGVAFSSAVPAVVDDAYRPLLMGAGGAGSGYDIGGWGGGIFHLTSQGPVCVAGEINVDGLANNSYYSPSGFAEYYSSGAGGTIFLAGASCVGTATARLSARGGNAITTKAGNISAGGGGGRVALWFGQDKASVGVMRERHAASAEATCLKNGFADWHGAIDVGGGTNVVPYNVNYVLTQEEPESWGQAGSVTFNGFLDPLGTIILIQ